MLSSTTTTMHLEGMEQYKACPLTTVEYILKSSKAIWKTHKYVAIKQRAAK